MVLLITLILLIVGWYYFSAALAELKREQQALSEMLHTLEARIVQLNSKPSAAIHTEKLSASSITTSSDTGPLESFPTPLPPSSPPSPLTSAPNDREFRTEQPPITYPDTYQENTSAPSDIFANLQSTYSKISQLKQLLRGNVVHHFFTNGNTLARVGVALLFIGAGLLIKLGADNGLFHAPIEWRLSAVGISGLALIALGWKLRHKKAGFALSLQGGGIALIYLTLFASLRLFHLLPTTMTFAMMLTLCLLSALLAVLQNTQALAVIATCGGFMAPIVTSSGDGNHVALFSYYLLLNFSILAMAWYRAWRALNLLGFAFTLIIGSVWGVLKYDSALWSSTQPFLIVFFLFYVALSILFALRQPVNLRGYVDGTLVFATPIIGFALQAALVDSITNGLTYSAITLCTFYSLLAFTTFRFGANNLRLLSESFLATGGVFGTLAIPLALDDQGTVAAWALEGVALIYVGIRQQRRYAFYIGFLLQLAAAFVVLLEMAFTNNHNQHWPMINSTYLSGFIMAISGLLCGFMLKKLQPADYYPRQLPTLTLTWTVSWWLLTHFYEIAKHSHASKAIYSWLPEADGWVLLFGSVSVLMAHLLGKKMQWPQLQQLEQTSLVFMLLAIISNMSSRLPIENLFTATTWIISFGCLYELLRQADPTISHRWQHGGALWIATLLITWQLCGWLTGFKFLATTWGLCCWLLIPSAALIFIVWATHHIKWPFKQHDTLYRHFVSAPIAATVIAGIVLSIFSQSGSSKPLTYLPLLNPLDISMAFAFVTLLFWQRHLHQPAFKLSHLQTKIAFAAMLFLWLNSALLRTLHQWYGLELTLAAITASNLAQTCLTILWSSIAMVVMFTSSQCKQRAGWIAGAILLSIVVIKLFLLDLDSAGSITRIISFIFVGVLMLVIGYFRPIPPHAPATARPSSSADPIPITDPLCSQSDKL